MSKSSRSATDTLTGSSGLRYALILGLLSAVGPFGIDLYLPAFPAIAQALHVDQATVQMSLVSYFLALAVGQLLWGPLADRHGRKMPLLAGFTLYLLACLVTAEAQSGQVLIVARFFQGLGACAGMVLPRSVVRDLGQGPDAARLFSMMVLVLGVSPILAPSLGAAVLAIYPWKAMFWLMASFAIICLLAIVFLLPETLRPEQRASRLSSAFATYGQLLTDSVYLRVVLTGAFAQAGFFAYLAGSPTILISLHGVSPSVYSLLFGLNAIALIGASQFAAPLLKRLPAARVISGTIALYLVLGALLFSVVVTGHDSLGLTVALLFLITACLGTLNPITSLQAVQEYPSAAGAASALMGAAQFGIGAIASLFLGKLPGTGALPLAEVILGCASLAFASNRLAARRRAPSH